MCEPMCDSTWDLRVCTIHMTYTYMTYVTCNVCILHSLLTYYVLTEAWRHIDLVALGSYPLSRHCFAPQCWQKEPPGGLPHLSQKSGQALAEGFDGTEAGLDGTLVGCAACWFVLGAPRLGMLGMEHEHDEKNRLNKPTRIRRMQ